MYVIHSTIMKLFLIGILSFKITSKIYGKQNMVGWKSSSDVKGEALHLWQVWHIWWYAVINLDLKKWTQHLFKDVIKTSFVQTSVNWGEHYGKIMPGDNGFLIYFPKQASNNNNRFMIKAMEDMHFRDIW